MADSTTDWYDQLVATSPIDRVTEHLANLVYTYEQLITYTKHGYPGFSYYGSILGDQQKLYGGSHPGYLADKAKFHLDLIKADLASANQELAFLENEVEQASASQLPMTLESVKMDVTNACVNLVAQLAPGSTDIILDTPEFDVRISTKKPKPVLNASYTDVYPEPITVDAINVELNKLYQAGIVTPAEAKEGLGLVESGEPVELPEWEKQLLNPVPIEQLTPLFNPPYPIETLHGPKPEYTFGTYVSPPVFLPMDGATVAADYLDLAAPAKQIYPTYAKQYGKTHVAKQITQKMLEDVLHDLYTPGWQKPDYVHDVVTESSDYGVSSTTLTVSGNSIGAFNYNDLIDVNGKQYLIKSVQTQDYGGFSTMTLVLDHLNLAVKQAKTSTDELAKSLQKAAKQKPWYAKFNEPKGKK